MNENHKKREKEKGGLYNWIIMVGSPLLTIKKE